MPPNKEAGDWAKSFGNEATCGTGDPIVDDLVCFMREDFGDVVVYLEMLADYAQNAWTLCKPTEVTK